VTERAEEAPPRRVVVIGVGNEMRGDDAAGILAARRLRELLDPAAVLVLEQPGEALGLLEQWEGFSAAVIIDAIGADLPAGSLLRHDASAEPLPADLRSSTSTHLVGVGESIELARVIGRLPPAIIVHGVQGLGFDTGAPVSGPVSEALGPLAERVRLEVDGLTA
jgi:hydrogenase maturation protease